MKIAKEMFVRKKTCAKIFFLQLKFDETFRNPFFWWVH